jgi:carbon-monoxide dehydrogenase small subunit
VSGDLQYKCIEFRLNGKLTRVDVRSTELLSDVLRDKLGLTAVKVACNEGTCGSCTVLMNGQAVYSCMILAFDCNNKSVETLEGLSDDPQHLHPLQQAFVSANASQCGFCTPGMIMSAKALLDKNPSPSREEVKHALSGNICRCTDYSRYVKAVVLASKKLAADRGKKKEENAGLKKGGSVFQ